MRLTHALVQVAQVLIEHPDRQHWGYDLSGKAGVRSGVLYPILYRMQEEGWVIADWDVPNQKGKPRPRRYYRVTDAGRTELAALLERARGDSRFQNIYLRGAQANKIGTRLSHAVPNVLPDAR